ncbi:MAG: rhodanese-like domain-containing protein [Porticoccus sp.]
MTNTLTSISAADFLSLSEIDKAVVIDVRTTAEFNNEFYPGCHNLPLQELNEAKFNHCLNENKCDGEAPVYLLCGSGMRAIKAFEQLVRSCDTPLIVIEGGINSLKQHGATIKKGSGSTISLERQVRIVAGGLVVVGVLLGSILNPLFYGISAFVGGGLIFAGVTDTCGMAMLLTRMPWNRVASAKG